MHKFTYINLSLKKRIMLIFILGPLLAFILLINLSYSAISSILHNDLQSAIAGNLKQLRISIEETITNMSNVSQQLAQGSAGINMSQYLIETDAYNKSQLIKEINNEISLISFCNSKLGLITYYFEDKGVHIFENTQVKTPFSPEKFPTIAVDYQLTYYCPHESGEKFNDKPVLSLLRHIDTTSMDDTYVYVEANLDIAATPFENSRLADNSLYLMLDSNKKIVFSQRPEIFQNNSFFDFDSKSASGLMNGYYWRSETSSRGFSVVSLISKEQYNKEKNTWIVQITLLFIIFIILSSISIWFLWRTIYRPINKFNKEIQWIEQANFQVESELTHVTEFDNLLIRFQNMKKQILGLIHDVTEKERKRANLEIEKLQSQINPHFLMNTLNTVHWLAVINHQQDIDDVVLALNKLLAYNLGKKGSIATIAEELEALEQYLKIQQTRYDFHYTIDIEAGKDVLNHTVPRFILQPLVENSIYHGLNDDGNIEIQIRENEKLEISIHDNGCGIPEDELKLLLGKNATDEKNKGLGIGLSYVRKALEARYGSSATLDIKSVVGKGTSIYVTFPIQEDLQ